MPNRPTFGVPPRQPETNHQLVSRAIALLQAGQTAGAEEMLLRVLKNDRRHADANNILGVIALERNELKVAEKLFRRALKSSPRLALAHNNLGEALRRAGNPRAAILSFRRALKCDPDNLEAHNNLGIALQETGDHHAAVEHLEAAAEKAPQDIEIIENLARAHLESGNNEAACTHYRRVIELDPTSPNGYNGLAVALKSVGREAEALENFERALTLQPSFHAAWKNLGLLQEEMGAFENALESYRRLVGASPDAADAHRYCGDVLRELGRMPEAIEAYERALASNPASHETYNNMGHAWRELGDRARAREAYLNAIEHGGDAAANWQAIAAVQHFREPNDDLTRMHKMLDNRRTTAADRMYLHFAIGKAREDLGDYRDAFGHYLEANAHQRRVSPYDEAADATLFTAITETFTDSFFAAFTNTGDPDATPIFILGMPRSGTTLVEQILSSHPEVYGAGELPHIRRIAQQLAGSERAYPAGLEDVSHATLAECGSRYLARLRQHAPDAAHITDKLPHNFLYVGLIHVMLPNASIILCERNPMDNGLSLFKTFFHAGQKYSCSLDSLGRYYKRYVKLVTHWDCVLPGRIHHVRYEQLVSDQEATSRELLARCGLEWHDACLEFHTNPRRVDTVSADQVRRPMYRDAVGAWQRYAEQLEPLRLGLGECADGQRGALEAGTGVRNQPGSNGEAESTRLDTG